MRCREMDRKKSDKKYYERNRERIIERNSNYAKKLPTNTKMLWGLSTHIRYGLKHGVDVQAVLDKLKQEYEDSLVLQC